MKSKYNPPVKTVVIPKLLHTEIVSTIEKSGIKIGKFVEITLQEKIDSLRKENR